MTRKIASSEHNSHLAHGIEKHIPTAIAPASLMVPFSDEEAAKLEEAHRRVCDSLREVIGDPYFSESGFILYQGDCVKLLRELAASDFRTDLTVTSPPYNIGKEYESSISVDAYLDWCATWMSGIYNTTKDEGAFWLNVGYLEVPNKGLCVPIPYLLWEKSDFYFIQEVVWKYGAGVQTKSRLSPRNEKWLFYTRNHKSYTFNLDDIRDPNVKYPNQKKDGKFRCNPLGKNPSDVWEFPKVTTGESRSSKERTAHPAQFPLAVVERIIRASSNKTEIVLDPFAGSCSAGIAAVGLGRIFVGFEMREDYCALAVKRFQDFTAERMAANRQTRLL